MKKSTLEIYCNDDLIITKKMTYKQVNNHLLKLIQNKEKIQVKKDLINNKMLLIYESDQIEIFKKNKKIDTLKYKYILKINI